MVVGLREYEGGRSVEPIYWLGIFLVLLVMEIMTMGLTTIWFAGGALAALAANLLGADVLVQCAAFLAVSLVLLLLMRPFAARYVNKKHERTNTDELIGTDAVVTETIDNLKGTGKAVARGLEWTARASEGKSTIEKGATVKIQSIQGVKLIVSQIAQ